MHVSKPIFGIYAQGQITDIVRIAVDQCNPHAIVKDLRQVLQEEPVHKVTGGGESLTNVLGAGTRVVDVDTQGILDLCGKSSVSVFVGLVWGPLVGVTYVGLVKIVDKVVGRYDDLSQPRTQNVVRR